MQKDAVIVLDPVNRDLITQEHRLRRPRLHRRQLHGELDAHGDHRPLSGEGLGRVGELRDVPIAPPAPGAKHMRELRGADARRWATPRRAPRRPRVVDPRDRPRPSPPALGAPDFPTAEFRAPLAGSLIPGSTAPSPTGKPAKSGRVTSRPTRSSGANPEIPVDSVCVRVGAMRCHSQALTIKLTARRAARRHRSGHRHRARLGLRRSQQPTKTRCAGCRPPPCRARSAIPVGRLRKMRLGGEYLSLFTVGDQLLWGAAEPLAPHARHPPRGLALRLPRAQGVDAECARRRGDAM